MIQSRGGIGIFFVDDADCPILKVGNYYFCFSHHFVFRFSSRSGKFNRTVEGISSRDFLNFALSHLKLRIMNDVNRLRLEEYLSSLECPVCHRCTAVEIRSVSGEYLLFSLNGQCCQRHWKFLSDVLKKESTAAGNAGDFYVPGRA